jgi:hypothetical protein
VLGDGGYFGFCLVFVQEMDGGGEAEKSITEHHHLLIKCPLVLHDSFSLCLLVFPPTIITHMHPPHNNDDDNDNKPHSHPLSRPWKSYDDTAWVANRSTFKLSVIKRNV